MKHCTTDKCPQILDSSCVFYEGASLIFSGINTNDSVETVIQKLNLKLESFPGINLNNYYKKTETYSQTEINGFLCAIDRPAVKVKACSSAIPTSKLRSG